MSSHSRADHGCFCIQNVVDDCEASPRRSDPLQHSNCVRERMISKNFLAEKPCSFEIVKNMFSDSSVCLGTEASSKHIHLQPHIYNPVPH